MRGISTFQPRPNGPLPLPELYASDSFGSKPARPEETLKGDGERRRPGRGIQVEPFTLTHGLRGCRTCRCCPGRDGRFINQASVTVRRDRLARLGIIYPRLPHRRVVVRFCVFRPDPTGLDRVLLIATSLSFEMRRHHELSIRQAWSSDPSWASWSIQFSSSATIDSVHGYAGVQRCRHAVKRSRSPSILQQSKWPSVSAGEKLKGNIVWNNRVTKTATVDSRLGISRPIPLHLARQAPDRYPLCAADRLA